MPTTNPNTKTKIKLNKVGINALEYRGMSDNTMLMILNQDGDQPIVTRRAIRWLCIQVLGQYGYEFEVDDNATSRK